MTSWRDLPSLVVVRAGEQVTKAPLAPRFQEAIDEAAMRLGDTGSDDYLAGWARGSWTPDAGSGTEVADRVVADLEAQWPPERLADVPGLPRPRAGPGMNRLAALVGDRPLIVDGGMGTLLQDRGLDDGGSGELWNVERPERCARATRPTPARAPGC